MCCRHQIMKKSSAAAGKAKPPAKRKKVAAANSHPLAKPLPEGVILTDLVKGEWKVGKPVGSGGFGLIYLADRNSSAPVSSSAQYVVKVEPVGNGPLFCELYFYQRAAKPDAVREWMSSRKLKSLGVPQFIATGLHSLDGSECRFLVMQRFGTDLQKLFEQNSKRFPTSTVLLLALKLLDILEYIHDKEYVHADIKASNLLIGYTDPQQVYLVDYGLAYRYLVDGAQKPYKEDPRRTHDGTIEFTSRDAHRGVLPSPRGDLEILGYCVMQWLCGRLPWEDNLENKDYVRDQKIRYMADIPALMRQCFQGDKTVPVTELSDFLRHIDSLNYNERPDYQRCRTIFNKALKFVGAKPTDKLIFGPSPAVTKSTPKAGSRKRSVSADKARSRSPLAGSPEMRLDLDNHDDEDVGVEKVKRGKVATKKQPAGRGRGRKAPAAAAATSTPPVVAQLANSVAKIPHPLASARLPVPTKQPSAATSSGLSYSRPAGDREVQVVKRRRHAAVNLATTATQTTPSLDRKY